MQLFGKGNFYPFMLLDEHLFFLIELTPGNVVYVFPNVFNNLGAQHFLQIRRATLFVLVFIINIPLVVYSVHYLIFGEKLFLFFEGWFRTIHPDKNCTSASSSDLLFPLLVNDLIVVVSPCKI